MELTSLLRSRFLARHATLLPTNGCFPSNHIPFPLFVGTGDWPIISQWLFAIEPIKLQQKDFPANLRIWDVDRRKSVRSFYSSVFELRLTTVFVDTRLLKTKHQRKRFQNFRQSCPDALGKLFFILGKNLSPVALDKCARWILDLSNFVKAYQTSKTPSSCLGAGHIFVRREIWQIC